METVCMRETRGSSLLDSHSFGGPRSFTNKIPAHCLPVMCRENDPADQWHPEHPNNFVVDAGPERAGPTDEGGTDRPDRVENELPSAMELVVP